jgi:hypothetical protein
MTSAWWLDASPQACWALVADARRWPSWWRSVPEVGALPRQPDPPSRPPAWRAMLGLPLRLRARQGTADPFQLIEWQIRGDLRARLTWVLSSSPPGGCDVTCRWEIEPMVARPDWLRSLTCLLLERSHFGRMRACAIDMGVALGCRSARLREWSGLAHR